MIPDKYIELIHREIDGRNSPKASAKLAAFLDGNPPARQFYDDLLAMSGMLQEVKPVEPPAHLPHVIMNRLPQSRPARRGLLAPVFEWLETRGKFKYAYAFAGGLAAGLAVFAIFFQTAAPPSRDLSQLSGAMIPREQIESLQTTANLEIKHEDVVGMLHLKNSAEFIVIELSLNSAAEIELAVAFDKREFAFKEVAAFDQMFPAEVNYNGSRVTVKHSGQLRYAMIFMKQPEIAGALHLQILRAGELLYEQTLAPDGKR